MAKYSVEIREVLSKVIILDAENSEEAKRIAVTNYREAKMDWVLGADDCIERSIDIMDESGQCVTFMEY